MKPLITIAAILTLAGLLTGLTDFWTDHVVHIGKTSVYNTAIGSDVHRIVALHRAEAEKLSDFANSYNKIAYNSDQSQSEICVELEKSAIEAIKQREKSFSNKFEVKCTHDTTTQAPELEMIIWPQIRHDYRFKITFVPTRR